MIDIKTRPYVKYILLWNCVKEEILMDILRNIRINTNIFQKIKFSQYLFKFCKLKTIVTSHQLIVSYKVRLLIVI